MGGVLVLYYIKHLARWIFGLSCRVARRIYFHYFFFIWMFTSCCEKFVLIMCWLIGFIFKLLIHYIVWLMVYIVFILRVVWYWFIFINRVFLRDVNLLIIINKAVNGHMTIYNLSIYNNTLLKMSRWKIIYFF